MPPSDAPELILIFGWMGARLPHIQKYTELYNQIYPSSTQLVVRSYPDFLYTNSTQFWKDVAPLAKMLQDYQGKKVLIHTYSNGGCLMLNSLAKAAHSATAVAGERSNNPLPATAVIFDSCPGTGDVKTGINAFTAGMKNPFVKYPFAALVALVYTAVRWFRLLTGKSGDHFDAMREDLLDPSVLAHNVPRTYIYSDTDPIIPHQAVEAHAKESKRLGIKVDLEVFRDTPHVNHIKGEGNIDRYLDVVQNAWKGALRQS